MTTTAAVQSAWGIVDQIIRVEIPDAVPGCGYLRAIESFEATDRMMWLTLPHVVSTILDRAGESYYRRTLIKHLATRVLGMVCDLKYDEAVNGDVMGYLAKNVELIRKTLAEIKGAN